MPGPTKLDKLVEQLRGFAKPKADIIKETTIRDPLGYSMVQRRFGATTGKMPSMKSERQMYQEGIEARMQPKYLKADEDVGNAYNEMDAYKDEWSSAVDDAKEYMKEDWETGLDDQLFEDVDPYYMEVAEPSTNLRDYWPNDARTPDEIYSDFDAAQDRYYAAKGVQRDLRRPEAWMQEQMLTPRYRNYQRAMEDRAANQRLGHQIARYKAEVNLITRLRRLGYSPEQIRAMMTMTGQYSIPETRAMLKGGR